MDKREIQRLIEQINERMLELSADSFEETCPIGIIDFEKWEWPQGIGLYGMYRYYAKTGDRKILERLLSWYERRIREGIPDRNVNTTAPMLTMAYVAWELYEEGLMKLCREWAEWVMYGMTRTEEGGIQHVVSGEDNEGQLWDDTLFMTVLFLAKMGRILGRKEYEEEACYQFMLHAKYLVDSGSGLWYHGWTFRERNHFANALWARGNCWITMGIPELLEILEPQGFCRKYLCGLLEGQVRSLARLQNKSGLWHTLLDDPCSYEEASASAGFAYGILKGIRMGLLPASFQRTALLAVDGVVAQIASDGTVGQVSYGTGMGMKLEDYKEIPLCPMAYGQALTAMMLGELL